MLSLGKLDHDLGRYRFGKSMGLGAGAAWPDYEKVRRGGQRDCSAWYISLKDLESHGDCLRLLVR